MKKFLRSGVAVVLAAATLLAGCGQPSSDTVAATLGDTDITYGVVNFYAQYMASFYDTYYLDYYGEDMWSSDLYGSGSTLTEDVRSDIQDAIEEMYRLDEHAADYGVELTEDQLTAIDEAAAQFIADNTDKANKQMGATQEIVAEVLRLMTIQDLVTDAVKESADVDITDEEAACRTFSYVTIDLTTGEYDESGNAVMLDDEEIAADEAAAQSYATASGDFSETMEAAGYDVSSYSYAADEDSFDEDAIAAADSLAEGETTYVETDDTIYIIHLDSEYDADATETHRQELQDDAEQEYYDTIYAGWQEEEEFTVVDSVWKKLNFDKLYTIVTDESGDASGDASADAS